MLGHIVLAMVIVCLSGFSSFAMEKSETQVRQEVWFAREEELLLLEEKFIYVATKSKKRVRKAPAIVTVISAKEIKNMGARSLTDVLRTVPGMAIQISQGHARAEIEVRGIGTRNSEKVLVLIDGHKINNPFFGGATYLTSDMPVDNIKKIEIVRGPGSALYGGSAFMAVINIITKKAEDVDGVQITGARGSFDTYRANLLFGQRPSRKLKFSGSLDYFNTDGADLPVDRDALYVAPLQPDISMAPGRTNRWVERYGLDLNLSYAALYFKGNFAGLEQGTLIGARNALSDESEIKVKQFFTELGIEHSFSKDSNILAKIYYNQFNVDLFFELFPEGYKHKIFKFPNGLWTRVTTKDRTLGLNLEGDYKLFKNNWLTLGYVYENIRQFDTTTHANFNPDTGGEFLPGFSFAQFIDVSNTHLFNKDTDREIWALYVQDDWQITGYLGLILGSRFDHYSDSGQAWSPRIGLTLQPLEDLDLKFLYGRAFRAPSFEELYNQHNVAVVGNPELDAETLGTCEAGIAYRLSKNYWVGVNYFHTEIDDLIVLGPTVSGTTARRFENMGEVEIDGVEVEFHANYSQNKYGYFNFSYQDARNERTGDRLPDVPQTRGNVIVNFDLTRHLNLNARLFFSGRRPRGETDSRHDLPGYALVDLTLIAKEFLGTMEIKTSVFNLFDKDYVDPALPTLPGDEPQPGRSYMLEVTYKF